MHPCCSVFHCAYFSLFHLCALQLMFGGRTILPSLSKGQLNCQVWRCNWLRKRHRKFETVCLINTNLTLEAHYKIAKVERKRIHMPSASSFDWTPAAFCSRCKAFVFAWCIFICSSLSLLSLPSLLSIQFTWELFQLIRCLLLKARQERKRKLHINFHLKQAKENKESLNG